MSKCAICGEPMPPGEEMFKMHGYSGDCPKPPVPKPQIAAVIEYVHRQEGVQFWLDIVADRDPWQTLGPFDSAEERQRVHDDLMAMMRSAGARDLPLQPQ